MKSRTAIVVIVTFLAGLYFILDFIVPPTLPGASSQGVVVSTTPAQITVQSGGQTVTYTLSGNASTRPQILLTQRDALGVAQLVATPLRSVRRGSKVTIRIGDAAGEQLSGTVTSIVNGSVTLIESGRRVEHRLGARTELIKVPRYGQGSEVQLYDVRAGDTIHMGPSTTFADNRDTASQFNTIITTMAFGIGLLSLAGVHGRTVVKRQPGWSFSLFFFIAVVVGVAAGVGKYADPGTMNRDFSDFIVLRLIASVYSAVFSLLAFYMASAAYRAFRIRTAEAVLMMVSAIVVMIGQTPFGNYLSGWMGDRFSALWLPNIAAWVLRVPGTAVFRGIVFGLMLGAMATAIRYWLSLERSVSAGN